MRYLLPVVFMMLPHAGFADVYKWIDSGGITHFTDNPSAVPEKYLPSMKKTEGAEIGIAPPAEEPSATPAPAADELDEKHWRSKFQGLRGRIEATRASIESKKEKLDQLRRKRTLYHKAGDRVAITTTEDEIRADEAAIKEMERELAELDAKAGRAGVPLEWRR